MAGELKISRSYHEALRRIGIQNPGEVGVGLPIQLTAAVDDFTHLAPPVQVPVVAVGTFTAAAAATHAGLEIVAGPTRGVWIDAVEERNNSTAQCFITTVAPATIVAAVAPLCFSGPVPTSVINTIRIATALPAGGYVIEGSDQIPLRFFLAPGQRFQVVHNTVNTAASYSVHFREVPLTGPVEP